MQANPHILTLFYFSYVIILIIDWCDVTTIDYNCWCDSRNGH